MKKKSSKKRFDLSTKAMLQKHVRQLQKDFEVVQGKALHLGRNTLYLSLGIFDSLKNPLVSFRNLLWKKDKTSRESKSKKIRRNKDLEK